MLDKLPNLCYNKNVKNNKSNFERIGKNYGKNDKCKGN